MINITKSQPPSPCLEIEKNKPSSKNYRCGDVYSRIKFDFHNKCYLCEEKEISSIQVEHFIPHKGNRNLMFDWNNLFFVCCHCNNTKLAYDAEILNCTDNNSQILDKIKFDIKPYPKEKANIIALSENNVVKNTVMLLNKIYNGTHTSNKIEESANIRSKLVSEIATFGEILREYYGAYNEEEKEDCKKSIIRNLNPKSAFTAFKVWIIKENEVLYKEFSQYLPS
jgi:hypothetical protein